MKQLILNQVESVKQYLVHWVEPDERYEWEVCLFKDGEWLGYYDEQWAVYENGDEPADTPDLIYEIPPHLNDELVITPKEGIPYLTYWPELPALERVQVSKFMRGQWWLFEFGWEPVFGAPTLIAELPMVFT
jgi:hypothetical protein